MEKEKCFPSVEKMYKPSTEDKPGCLPRETYTRNTQSAKIITHVKSMTVCKRVTKSHGKIQKRTLSPRVPVIKGTHPREDMEQSGKQWNW